MRLDNVKLRNKLLLLYFLSVFFPVLLTNLLFYSVTTQHVRERREQDISLALDQARGDLRARIDAVVGISSVFYADAAIDSALERTYTTPVEYLDAYDEAIRPTLGKYGPVYGSIRNMTIYTDNPTVLGAGGVGFLGGEERRSGWFRQVMAAQGGVPAIVRERAGEEDVFSVVRKLDGFGSGNNYLKILKIKLHSAMFHQSFVNRALYGELYLIGPDGEVAFSTRPEREWRERGVRFAGIAREDASVFARPFGERDYLRGWTVVGALPDSVMSAEMRKPRLVAVYLTCANFLLPTIVIVWISKSLHGRLLAIVRQMKLARYRNFETAAHADPAKDEIGQLSMEFSRMTRQIRRLIDDVYAAELQRKELELESKRAQLHALQSQINPHFLFNALEALRMRSLLKGEEETARIVRNMARLFRKSLGWGNDWVTVGQELELIVSFLEIQQYRLGDKLRCRIETDEAAAGCRIPKMILLPFVENASIHGIEKIEGPGTIVLSAAVDQDELVFRLRDNGFGMDEATLEALRLDRPLADDDERHVGIRNVKARLRLYYGDRATLDIASDPAAGTSVVMRLPQQLNIV